MKADKKFSNLSMLEKRKRLMDMVDMRKKMKRKKTERPILMFENGDKINSKKPINGSTKMKKLNAVIYKKMFQSARSKDEQRPDKSIKEYWVPVRLSRMQMEQYCSLLHSNFEEFSSSLRDTSSLHEILTQTQKCCDHPYLVDPSLRGSLKTNVSIDQLDAEINVSGKLQLLDKLLLEMERCRLRVVVLFQSVINSEKISTGDILDDLVDRRFGQDFYIHIRGKIITNSERDKRKKDLKSFNSVESNTFICLMDYRACHPSIIFSSVDVAILFNSDWNPLNDLKALHKLTLDSRERLRVLRLYSSFTIEEKALILSKQGMNIFEKNTSSMKYNFYHQLLAWGVSYLLSKVSDDPSSKLKLKSKSKSDAFIDYLVREVSSLLLNKKGSTNCLKSLIISNAQMRDGSYSKNILLLGEIESRTNESSSTEESLRENGPLAFWTNLFKGIPLKDSSNNRVSRRVQKSFRNPWSWFEEYEIENEIPVKTKSRSKRTRRTEIKQSTNNVAECTNNQPEKSQPSPVIPPVCKIERSTTCVAECTNNQAQQPQTSPVVPPVCEQSSNAGPLETELKIIKKEQQEITNLHEKEKSMLLSECEREILEVRKKYNALIDESEMCVTKKMKVLEEFYDLVYANKVLAETLTQACDDTFSEEKIEKETSSVRMVEIPASTLVQLRNQCTTSITGGHGLRGTGITRAPAPHLRSSPSLFASLPNLSNHQTQVEFSNVINEVNTKKRPVQVVEDFNSLFDMGYRNLPFLDSN